MFFHHHISCWKININIKIWGNPNTVFSYPRVCNFSSLGISSFSSGVRSCSLTYLYSYRLPSMKEWKLGSFLAKQMRVPWGSRKCCVQEMSEKILPWRGSAIQGTPQCFTRGAERASGQRTGGGYWGSPPRLSCGSPATLTVAFSVAPSGRAWQATRAGSELWVAHFWVDFKGDVGSYAPSLLLALNSGASLRLGPSFIPAWRWSKEEPWPTCGKHGARTVVTLRCPMGLLPRQNLAPPDPCSWHGLRVWVKTLLPAGVWAS